MTVRNQVQCTVHGLAIEHEKQRNIDAIPRGDVRIVGK